jgi:Family of unknown function (DUF5317)
VVSRSDETGRYKGNVALLTCAAVDKARAGPRPDVQVLSMLWPGPSGTLSGVMAGLVVLVMVPVLAGVAAGYAAGGRLSTIVGRLRGLWLLWAAVAAQAAQFSLHGARVALLVVVYALVLGWLILNLPGWTPAMRTAVGIVLLGLALNAAAIAANGRMPYSPQAAALVGLPAAETTAKNEPSNQDTRLALLGDVIPVAAVHKVISIGDVLIALGGAALIAAAMRRDRRTAASRHEIQGGES